MAPHRAVSALRNPGPASRFSHAPRMEASFFSSRRDALTLTPYRRPCFCGQWRAEITLTRRARHGHDQLALVLRAPGYFDGSPYIRTRGNAGEDAFLLRQPSRHRKGVVVAHLNALGDLWVSFFVLQMKV